ncbi:IS110 family transposase [Rhodococcus sp. 1168]|uniref:IS110 family transposase n=1 Tax=Rhodococcus sp. 1168 TaxID=2018041 RepID=UPI000A0BEE42|nr:IS110 family transposase [Rhodococcus sp. 1168]ORI13545.1 IS110 family transposase [Rhodococcus sp. 1168]
MTKVWVGVDAGKTAHHCVVVDSDGQRLLSRRIVNDESTIEKLIDDVTALSDGSTATWATDLNSGGAALMLALLVAAKQVVFYIPGRVIYHAAAGYRGEGKTDAKDAAIIADQARIRRDLHRVRIPDESAAALRILTGHRTDRMRDRTRTINRLRALLSEFFPALERNLDLSNAKGTLILLTGYQTPDRIRRMGRSRLETWLRTHKVYNPDKVADVALDAARAQHARVPGQDAAAGTIATLARQALDILAELAALDKQITALFSRHRYAAIIESMPGFGPLLGAEFIAATGGDMESIGSADRLAALSGLAPVPRDSGRISGNLHRPRRYDRRLMRVFYLSAQLSIRSSPESDAYYQRKRAEGKRHTQAVIGLARRRANVLWAMLRDERIYAPAESEKGVAA